MFTSKVSNRKKPDIGKFRENFIVQKKCNFAYRYPYNNDNDQSKEV